MARIPDGPVEPVRAAPPTDYELAIMELIDAGRRQREELARRRVAARLGIELPTSTWER